jgi:CBS domain containing-hemolysin-like protein
MTQAGHVLKPGEVLRHNGLLFQVEGVEKRRLIRVRLELPEEVAETQTRTADSAHAAG